MVAGLLALAAPAAAQRPVLDSVTPTRAVGRAVPPATADSVRERWQVCQQVVIAGTRGGFTCTTRTLPMRTLRTAPPPPPPPPSDTVPYDPVPAPIFPNAPTWGRVLWDAEWSRLPAKDYGPHYEPDNGSGLGSQGWDNISFASGLTTPWAPNGTGAAYTIRIPQGFPGGYGPAWIGPIRWATVPPLSFTEGDSPEGEMYLAVWVRLTATGGPFTNPNQQKLVYLSSRNNADGYGLAHIIICKRADCGDLGVELQDRQGGYDVVRGVNEPLNDGRWHLIEVLIRRNTFSATAANADGRIALWLDGRLLLSATDRQIVRDVANRHALLNWVTLNPITGGGTAPMPRESFIQYGRLRLQVR